MLREEEEEERKTAKKESVNDANKQTYKKERGEREDEKLVS